jgi:hypothetical protein
MKLLMAYNEDNPISGVIVIKCGKKNYIYMEQAVMNIEI